MSGLPDNLPRLIVLPGDVLRVLPDLSGATAKMLLVLGGHLNRTRRVAWPGTARLMALTGIKRRETIRRVRSELERIGFTIERGRPGRNSRYHLPDRWGTSRGDGEPPHTQNRPTGGTHNPSHVGTENRPTGGTGKPPHVGTENRPMVGRENRPLTSHQPLTNPLDKTSHESPAPGAPRSRGARAGADENAVRQDEARLDDLRSRVEAGEQVALVSVSVPPNAAVDMACDTFLDGDVLKTRSRYDRAVETLTLRRFALMRELDRTPVGGAATG